ncbi:MAG: DUF805 domain-containing protein [Bdellovibrionales bacterium]|nr:DUF805 domain-containing protein [Bdellovibrionales bacterium]
MEQLTSLLPDWDFLLSYEGRVNRRDFWLKGQLFFFLISLSLHLLNLTTLSIMFFIISGYSVTVIAIKRFHDLGLSGYYILLGFVPLANIWVFFKLGFCKGDMGRNIYGPAVEPVVIKKY